MKRCMTMTFPEGFKPLVTEDRKVFKNGIRVTDVGRGKLAVHLGAGDGGKVVEFHRKNAPPVVGEYPHRRLFEANILEVKDGKDFILTGPTADEVRGGILLCINTKFAPKNTGDKASGWWERPSGAEPQPLPKGWGSRAVEGGGQSAYWHGLVLLNRGNVLFVYPEGGEQVPVYYDPKHGLGIITLSKANWLINNTDTADIVVPVPVTPPAPATTE